MEGKRWGWQKIFRSTDIYNMIGNRKIKKCLKKYEMKIAVKKSKAVFDFIRNKDDEDITRMKRSWVYRIKYGRILHGLYKRQEETWRVE